METSTASLSRDDVPVGMPLEWPILDECGSLLYESGATVPNEQDLHFLFAHFRPFRPDCDADPGRRHPCAGQESDHASPVTLKDMHLSIGGLLGIRSRIGSSAMHPSRLIGFSPSQTLFVTPPLANGRPEQLIVGENVDVVAVASHAVFRFACTVEAICSHPFDYVVLSAPGAIRRLRERKAIRIRTRMPVRYAHDGGGYGYDSLGLASGLSAFGMSLVTSRVLGQVGDRLRLAFRLHSKDLDAEIETNAVIRNVQLTVKANAAATHGLEFEPLEPSQQLALKSFVFDRQDDAEYWTTAAR